MYWIVTLQLIFGIMFARRTLQKLLEKNLIDQKRRSILGTMMFTIFFLITYVTRHAPAAQMCALSALCGGISSLDPIFQWRLKRRINSEFPDFIGRIILAMKSGYSFRAAVERDSISASQIWEKWLHTLIESRVFLRVEHVAEAKWWRSYVEVLRRADENPHHALTQLENFRRKLKILSEFRRKSGQALLQARIQLLVMTCLYLALLGVTMTQFQLKRYRPLICLSSALFLAGQATFWWIARKTKWKV